MDNDRLEGSWKEFKGRLRERYAELTDDEVEEARGNREQVEGRLQQKLGQTKDEARRTVDDILNSI